MQSSSFACSYNSQARLLDLDYLSRCFRPMKTTSLVAAPFLITSLLSQPFPIQQLLHGIATEHLEWCQVAMVSAFLFVFLCLSCGSKTLLRYFIWLPFTFAFTQTQVFLFLFMSLQPSCRIISSHSFFCACTSGPQRARAHLHWNQIGRCPEFRYNEVWFISCPFHGPRILCTSLRVIVIFMSLLLAFSSVLSCAHMCFLMPPVGGRMRNPWI